MARNAEVIRQWRILRELEGSLGVTIRQLATLTGVTTRTIRRDLDALQEAGFPLYDETTEGERRWRLRRRPLKELDDGFTLGELSALYFSRTLMECLVGTPFHDDLRHAFSKLERSLGTRLRAFLDRLPAAIQAKPGPTRRGAGDSPKTIGRLLDAILHQRRVSMRYDSRSSGREKTYGIDPYRLVYADDSLYLFAFVPEYGHVRTFAVDRIRSLTPLEESFEIVEDLGDRLFGHSLGVHDGDPERVEVEFSAGAAAYVTERVWHPSQAVTTQPDGSVLLSFDICTDTALRRWVLGFGREARVTAPGHLADAIAAELAEARSGYGSDRSRDDRKGSK